MKEGILDKDLDAISQLTKDVAQSAADKLKSAVTGDDEKDTKGKKKSGSSNKKKSSKVKPDQFLKKDDKKKPEPKSEPAPGSQPEKEKSKPKTAAAKVKAAKPKEEPVVEPKKEPVKEKPAMDKVKAAAKKIKSPSLDISDKPLNKMDYEDLVKLQDFYEKRLKKIKGGFKGKGGKGELDIASAVNSIEKELKGVDNELRKPKRVIQARDTGNKPEAESGVRKRAEELAKEAGHPGDEKVINGIIKKMMHKD